MEYIINPRSETIFVILSTLKSEPTTAPSQVSTLFVFRA
uniref:Uncharacterized protein n=1 Tax=Nelumbo nucifera TaxID=4432 RepID=A0A822ZTJ7_NELNU|nr:TPA_asm: hypothetical protein HUJ06_016799 [Nelumbo nucifera]